MLLKSTRSGARLVLLAAISLVVSPNAGMAGTFFEGFEDGTLGAMAPMNIDAELHDLEASDGYRCQYNDPDSELSNSYCEPPASGQSPWNMQCDCYVGATQEQAEEFFWNVVDGRHGDLEGRSFTGRHSVWMGAIHDPNDFPGKKPSHDWEPISLTTPMATLEALVTGAPILLESDGDTPVLSFMHQISFPDYRTVNVNEGRSVDGGVVQVQVVDGSGAPQGDWETLVPYQNTYDQQREDNYVNCMFDPTDDGNTEDDLYDGSDRLGPSSLCYDQWVFVHLGDTDEEFDAANVGNADGPGLEGATGLGTWVESRFYLSDYRGEYILIRFITSGLKAGSAETYEDLFWWNPTPGDDGWFIDDITVTGVVDASEELGADDATRTAPAGGLKTLQARPTP